MKNCTKKVLTQIKNRKKIFEKKLCTYDQVTVFIIIFFYPLVRLFSNFACRIHFLLRIFWDYRRQNRTRLKFSLNFGHLAKFAPLAKNEAKFFFEFWFVLVLFWSSFSRWFRISRSRRMKVRRKKVISRARLSSTLRKFSKKYVSFRGRPDHPRNFFSPIAPAMS